MRRAEAEAWHLRYNERKHFQLEESQLLSETESGVIGKHCSN